MDDVEQFWQIRDEIDAQGQQFQRPLKAETAKDSTGLVTATVGPDSRLTDLRIDGRADVMRAEELAAAVMEAVTAAGIKQVEGWASGTANELKTDSLPPARPVPLAHESFAGRTDELVDVHDDLDGAMDRLLQFMDELNASADQAASQMQTFGDEQFDGKIAGARATVGPDGALRGLTLDQDWMSTQSMPAIARKIKEAIAAAVTRTEGHTVGDVLGRTELGRLSAIATDPIRFAQHLGLE